MINRIELAKHFHELGFKKGAEIGVADGIFSLILCQSIPELELFCIDPWDTYKENQRGGGKDQQHKNYDLSVEKLKPYNAHLIRKMSMDAVNAFDDDSLDFVYIDANHNFDYVMRDIIEWSRKVRKGGIISGHDYYHFNNSGVIEAVNCYISIHRINLNLTEWNKSNHIDDRCPSWWFVK